MMMKKNKILGFSLIELMVTVAIIAILATIAYPSYTDHVVRTNRTEAQRELLRLANLQEQFYSDNRSYTDNMTQLGMPADPYITQNDAGNNFYSIDTTGTVGDIFTLRATAINEQATMDTDCSWLAIDNLGRKTAESADCWR